MMSFSDIKGHSIQIRHLVDSVNRGRVSCAYLFIGPSGIGKRLTAFNFAKFINCRVRNHGHLQSPISGVVDSRDNPCDQCSSCKKIDSGQHPDIFFISGDTPDSIKIESIRQIEKRSYFKPYEAIYKIFIIDGAENMTQESSNALLKTLEEPPNDTIFILIAHHAKKLFATVVSRCRKIKFNALSLKQLKEILIDYYHLDEKKAQFISYFSEGRLAFALKFKDDDILKEKNAIIDDFVHRNVNFNDRDDARYRLNLFLAWLRDLLLLKIGRIDSMLINIDRQSDLIKMKNRYTIDEIDESINFISEALSYLEKNINLRLLNNLVRIRLCRG